MKKIFTLLFMCLTGLSASITVFGCFTENDEVSASLYVSDTADLNGVTFSYKEDSIAQLIVDYYSETNKRKEVLTLREDPIPLEYYYNGNRYRTLIKYNKKRREVILTSKKVGE